MYEVDFDLWTQKETDEFVEGFMSVDDIGVNDWETDYPWGCPWVYLSVMVFNAETPYEQGIEWFKRNRAEILESMQEKEEDEY